MIDKKRLASLAGEREYLQKPEGLNLPTVRLQGKEGYYLKIENNKEKDLARTELGKEISGVILRVRRKLVGSDLFSTEHNSYNDIISLSKSEYSNQLGKNVVKKIAVDRAKNLKEAFGNDISTTQIVYFLLKVESGFELVKFNVKGASLGSKSKEKDSVGFYDYIKNSFNRSGNDEHAFEYITNCDVREERGSKGVYYVSSFKRGEKLGDEDMAIVAENLEKIGKVVLEEDEYQESFIKNEIAQIVSAEKQVDIQQPDQTINQDIKQSDMPSVDIGDNDEIKDNIQDDDLPF